MDKEAEEAIRQIQRGKGVSQTGNQNKTLIYLLIVIGAVFVGIVAWIMFSNSQNTIDYKGIEFQKVDEIAPYRTGIPVVYSDKITGAATKNTYYFYFRNNPLDLERIEFDGAVEIKESMAIKTTGELNCKGYGAIGLANLAKFYQIIGTRVMNDQNATCDEQGRYMLLHLEESNETKIEQIGPSCYTIKISDCEVLEALEKFMLESIVTVDEALES